MFKRQVKTHTREELVDITGIVREALRSDKSEASACMVFIPHTTAGVTINENADPDVKADIISGLNRMIPMDQDFRHSEGNSDAHIKASLLGSSVMVPLENSQLVLGTWQGIFLAEFDGPRTRTVIIKLI
ncbi:secondary thiamine-phosphate synthase enzyme YjbQ [Syntrophomonas palmitatica]|uniref:secondary thiamine-phosphate synthase enzyme YjbQ n=1 Tax=Syntrophomonas palmitatica TaxID=402877 RepID=UPI0006D11B6E|nr:secondary thiamine-phosphate synthase enzyme YjbQ [Syntrophomonas palmitatica]